MHTKPKFDPARDLPDLTGKVVLVTGGNSGIGYETVKVMLLKNATVYLAARSLSKGNEAIAQLETETGKRAKFLELDLADLRTVRKAAEAFFEREERLDILFNNGGVMIPPTDQLTAQGYDLQFGTNVLGHFFLTELLLPALNASHTHTSVPARIINTSSAAHTNCPKPLIFFDTVKGGVKRDAQIKKWGKMMAPWTLYGASKTANIIVANHYAATCQSSVLVSCSLHPGIIQTGLQRTFPGPLKLIVNITGSPAHVGAHNQLWAAVKASPGEINGRYFVPVGVQKTPSQIATDVELGTEVIAYLKEAVRDF
ncbi:NAD(P)-binding protein [Mycena albidolilacea]|uniref:NAD(P)-binding protein n=1 Tax=Mycena albidolilacea TaxID=1033008 RepID=A0AAD7ALY1_9AGAR|nr:NAD(P)-binding protein [Mycena albidolilacea]